MIKRKKSGVSPVSGLRNSWELNDKCKMYLPCDRVVGTDCIEEKKSGAKSYSDPDLATPYTLTYDADDFTVYSDRLVNGTGNLFFDKWQEPIDAGKSCLFMYAGYLRFVDDPSEITDSGARVAIGSTGGSIEDAPYNGRFSMAQSHTVISGNLNVALDDYLISESQYNPAAYAGRSETAQIESVVGVGGYFYKVAVYRPDGLLQETKIFNGLTGVEIASYTLPLGTDIIGTINIRPALKLAGLKMTSLLRVDFDVVPDNYLDLAFLNASEWYYGNKIVLPYWR